MQRRTFLHTGAALGVSLLPAVPALAQAPAPKGSTMTPAQTGAARKRVFITGSADGLGQLAARSLQAQGHQVVVHVRSQARLTAVRTLVEQGAIATVGDLSDLQQIRDLARQVNEIGRMDAVIHNAGVMSGPHVLVVNTVAPYLLTAWIERPRRLIYLSSGMHRGGNPDLTRIDWTGARPTGSYSDSKLYVTALAAAVARRWPEVVSNAVNPGWVPTRMGGPGAPDDLALGHATQEWLAVSEDRQALTSGGYWHHRQRAEAHPAVHDIHFQDQLLAALARATGTTLA